MLFALIACYPPHMVTQEARELIITVVSLEGFSHDLIGLIRGERVIAGNLTRLSRLLRILRFHVHDLNLKPSLTVYMRFGKGPKQRLRFTKSGDAKLEEAYATHFVWPGKEPFHPPAPKEPAT
jgi:hypothetical protein